MVAPLEQPFHDLTPFSTEGYIPAPSSSNLNLVSERARYIANNSIYDPHAAADVAQQAALNYWRNEAMRGAPEYPLAYLGTVVRHEIANHGRRVQARLKREASLDEVADNNSQDTEPLPMLRAPGSSIPAQIAARETLDQVSRYWPLLTDQQRSYLNLSVEGLMPAEIADRFGVTPNVVSATLMRARSLLRTLIELSTLDQQEVEALLNVDKEDKEGRKLARLYKRKQRLDPNPQ
jgi:RNA polymerase sigma factor (sigma-70 family)